MNQPVINTWKEENRFWEHSLNQVENGLPEATKALIGWDGVVVWDQEIDPVDMLNAYVKGVSEESCGQCTPCRLGTRQMLKLTNAICSGNGSIQDLDRICFLVKQIGLTARCDLGRTMAKPVTDLINEFQDEFLDVIQGKRKVRKEIYQKTITAPCISACPAHVNIPAYIEYVRMEKWEKAMEIVRKGCPMPGTIGRVCVRPCEAYCKRGDLDSALSIRAIKRFLADKEMKGEIKNQSCPEVKNLLKIAIIGAGPAGLSCAYYLGKKGYAATIFEANEGPGGMAAYGIPSYRLPREVIDHEVDVVKNMGAEIRYNVTIGKDISVDELSDQGYQAIFLATGAPKSAKMRCEGEDAGYEGFMAGVEFLAESARKRMPLKGGKAVVIGGGNVAMDCVRTLKRFGFQQVNLLYRRTEVEMPADPVEIREAKEEGVIFDFLVAPVQIIEEGNKVTGLECKKMALGEPDKSGRRRPVPIEGSEFIISCDAIIPAVGQACIVDEVIPADYGLTTAWKTLVVNEATGQSEQSHIFGGGDCVTGPKTLIAALTAGKKAADYIETYLNQGMRVPEKTEAMENLITKPEIFIEKIKFPYPGCTEKIEVKPLDPDIRVKNFNEVESGYSVLQARKEAGRCLRCYRMLLSAV